MELIKLLFSYKKRHSLIKKIFLNEFKTIMSNEDKILINILYSKLNIKKIE